MKLGIIKLEILFCMKAQGFMKKYEILMKYDLLGVVPIWIEEEINQIINDNLEVV